MSGTQRGHPLVIDFGNPSVVKGLAKKLKREVRSWGDLISHQDALKIVARAFGHDGYEELHSRLGLANASLPDCAVPPEEAARRYRQYVAVLTENDFSTEEAVHLLKIVTLGLWWNFTGERVPPKIHGTRIKVAETEIEFVDPGTAQRLFGIFKRSINAQGLLVEDGPRHLFAKMFGHATFDALLARAGHGNPSVPDFYRSPESLDDRVRGYLRVLSDAAIGEDAGILVLREGIRRMVGHRRKRVGHLEAATPRRPGREWTHTEMASAQDRGLG